MNELTIGKKLKAGLIYFGSLLKRKNKTRIDSHAGLQTVIEMCNDLPIMLSAPRIKPKTVSHVQFIKTPEIIEIAGVLTFCMAS